MRAAWLAGALAGLLAVAVYLRTPGEDRRILDLLDEVVPGLMVGGQVGDDAIDRYDLEVAPYVGYMSRDWRGPEGTSHLMIRVNEYVDEGDPTVGEDARVQEIIWQVRIPNYVEQWVDRMDREFGVAVPTCFRRPEGDTVAHHYWAGIGRRGILLERWLRRPPRSLAADDRHAVPQGGGAFVIGASDRPLPSSFAVLDCGVLDR